MMGALNDTQFAYFLLVGGGNKHSESMTYQTFAKDSTFSTMEV